MPSISSTLDKLLKKYGVNPKTALWECHGKWIIYHKDLEAIARKAGIRFDPPIIIEADGANKVAAICVVARMDAGDGNFSTMEWSIGEASPHNYRTKGDQPAYPYAMAEKRAKGRSALKLLCIHGEVYSEEEADDFKPKDQSELWGGPLTKTKLKEAARDFCSGLEAATTMRDVEELEAANKSWLFQMKQDMPGWYEGVPGSDVLGLGDRIADKKIELRKLEELEPPR